MKYETGENTQAVVTPNESCRTENVAGLRERFKTQRKKKKNLRETERGITREGGGGLRHEENKRRFPLLRVLALQAAVSLLLLGVFWLFSSSGDANLQGCADTVKNALQFNMAKDDGDEIGKIKFVDKIINIGGIPADTLPLEMTAPLNCAVDCAAGILTFKETGGEAVVAVERGTVSAVFSAAGKKIVEITHPGGVVSRYIGLRAAGKALGSSVSKGEILGVADEELTFCLFLNGNLVASTVVNGNSIEW